MAGEAWAAPAGTTATALNAMTATATGRRSARDIDELFSEVGEGAWL
jgi:hypothetical protein